MSGLQKAIKYSAMAFAVFLAVNIIGSIFFGIAMIGNIFNLSATKTDTSNLEVLELNKVVYEQLDIEIASSNIVIKEGSNFKVETNNKYIEIREENTTLEIEEKEHFWTNDDSTLIIYVPYDYKFKKVSLESGAGIVSVTKLNVERLDLDLGAGKVEFDGLVVTEEADIEGGAGALNFSDSVIKNLDLDMGVGRLEMNAKLTGNNNIQAGIGDAIINLVGSKNDYMIRVNKGIGDAIIDDEVVDNNTYRGTGSTNVYIDGGIGMIVVKYSE